MSPARCLACQHPQRQELDRRLVMSSPPNFSALGQLFDLDHDCVRRHYKHLPAAVVRAGRINEVATADRILTLVEDSLGEIDWVIGEAKRKGDLRAVMLATKARATQMGVLISAASLILEERKITSAELPVERRMRLADIEALVRRRIDNEVASALAVAEAATPANPRSTPRPHEPSRDPSRDRSAVRAPRAEPLPAESAAELPEAAAQ